jgi:hypothetical protein
MQPYKTVMIKHFYITFLFAVITIGAFAQTTSTANSSSPYSQFGLGDINPALLPQNDAMGGIATAINRIGGYNNINPLNPASYATINFTTIDAGIYTNFLTLNQSGQASNSTANFRLSHITFAIPVSKSSALSFGLLPYSDVGYNNRQTLSKGFGTGSPVDTNAVNYLSSGNGGLSKAYIGYGFTIAKHLFIGGNVSYIFGNIEQINETEIPTLYGVLNSRVDQSNAIGGINYDYGAQYSFDLTPTRHLVLGYSTSASTMISTTSTYVVSQYTYDSSGNQNIAADSLINRTGSKGKIKLPAVNHFGVSFQSDGQFLVGADYTTGKWSNLTVDGINQGFQDSKTFNIGGQLTPNINSLHNYFARSDYRLGFMYNDTYLNINNTPIKAYALTFGMGLPLSPNGNSFYKINWSAEIGQRGTLVNGLVRENYVTLHLGFTLNDKWFQRFKFD